MSAHADAGYRLFSDDSLVALFLIRLFKQLGYELKEIKEIMEGDDLDVRASISAQI